MTIDDMLAKDRKLTDEIERVEMDITAARRALEKWKKRCGFLHAARVEVRREIAKATRRTTVVEYKRRR